MKQFETFGEYMFDLLFAPLKKGRKTVNQLRIFFKVMGREFDDLKAAIFRVRSEANVASCSEVMLPVHGQDRDMPRLEGEDAEAYRTRLSMKGIISQWSGTRRGVLYALTALGYDRSRIELFADQDAERWAEFIIFLNSSKPSGVTNLSVIDGQVRKVKEGSSKPAYGMETIGGLIIQSRLQTGFSRYPRCGEIVCGVWPHIVSEGHLVASTVMAQGGASGGGNPFPRAGTFAASEEFYHFGAYTIYQGFASDIEVGSKAAQGAKVYLNLYALLYQRERRRSRMKTLTSIGIQKIGQRFVDSVDHADYTLNGVPQTAEPFRRFVQGASARVYIYFDDTVIGDVAEVQLVDKDGDIIASAGERVFTKTPGKGLYIAFKYNILEVEVESSNENL